MPKTCSNCGSRPCGNFRDLEHGACKKWSVMVMVPKWEADEKIKQLKETATKLRIHVGVVDCIAQRTLQRTGHVSDIPSPATGCMGFLEADLKYAKDSVVNSDKIIATFVKEKRNIEGHVKVIEGIARELATALTKAQHDLDTSEGLTCCDSEVVIPELTWKLTHSSSAAVDAALARAREAGIEVGE